MTAIRVSQLGKKFKLFRSTGSRLLEYLSLGRRIYHNDFWALRDISFEVPKATTVGILGQNGSGKSTLLSILAGVLEPSAGSFEMNGKVSAILELGSGFHPEFSGRDNVYMYGSIMGLSRQEIDGRFDEIVQFSELGDFIDQPLRTYSSGMIVRLAFSVAINVNADILIVDEALAVGDAIFQHRCFRKIREMQEEGKTILYVGHDTEAVRNICNYALLLDGGQIIERGDPNIVVNKYNALIAERERTYNEGNLIEHGVLPEEGYEVAYNFIQNLADASIKESDIAPVQEITIDSLSPPRRVILAHPFSRITYSVTIEPRSSLAFAIGILPAAWDKIPQGVKFDIDVNSGSNQENIFSRVLQPRRNIGDRGWHNFIIPLDKYSGKTVRISFRTASSGDDISYCWSAWGWGKIIVNTKYQDNVREIPDTHADTPVPDLNGLSSKEVRYGNKKAEIIKIELLDEAENPSFQFTSGETAIIKVHVLMHQDIEGLISVGCVVKNKFGEIYGTNNWWKNYNFPNKKKNDVTIVKFTLPLKLAHGLYSLTPGVAIVHSISDIEYLDIREDCIFFKVNESEHIAGIVDLEACIEFILPNSEY